MNNDETTFKLQQKKLDEVKLKKRRLKDQLKILDDSITYIEQSLPDPKKPPKIFNESEDEHTIRVTEFKALVKRLNDDKLKRKIIIEKLEAERLKKEIQETEEMMKLKSGLEEEAKILKQKKLDEMKTKAQDRKEKIKAMGKLLKETMSVDKPIFQVLEEKFKNNVEMPELEKRKAELARKHILYRPLSHSEFEHHAHKYDYIQKEAERRRGKEIQDRKTDEKVDLTVISQFKTKSMIAVIEQEKQEKLDKEKEAYERKVMNEKQKRYAELVKEMFTPVVDLKKRYELQLRIEKPARPRIVRNESYIQINRSASSLRSVKNEENKKSRANHSVASDVKSKISDYLSDKRKERSNLSLDYSQIRKFDIDNDFKSTANRKLVIDQAKEIEKIARKKEIIAKSVMSSAALDLEEQVNDMLLESVKAKMKLLNN